MTHYDNIYTVHTNNLYADADARSMSHDPQAETPGNTHFGAYQRPPDGHFFN